MKKLSLLGVLCLSFNSYANTNENAQLFSYSPNLADNRELQSEFSDLNQYRQQIKFNKIY